MSEMLGKWLFSCWFGIWQILGVQPESKIKNKFDQEKSFFQDFWHGLLWRDNKFSTVMDVLYKILKYFVCIEIVAKWNVNLEKQL